MNGEKMINGVQDHPAIRALKNLLTGPLLFLR